MQYFAIYFSYLSLADLANITVLEIVTPYTATLHGKVILE